MAGELPPRKPSAGWQVVRRNAGRTAARFRNVRLDRIVGLYARAATIGWRRPVARIPQPRPERVVVSLSTIPSRVDHLRSVLHSLLDQSVPALSLRGNSAPLIANGVVYDGFDSGKVVAVRVEDGNELWSQALANGEGRTEVERLADVDGDIVSDGATLFAAGYRGRVAALALDSGRPLWQRDLSSYTGAAVNDTAVIVVDAEGNVWAFDRETGVNLWKQDQLKYRWLGAPAIQGRYVVVGDSEGWVHWLNVDDGKFAARERLGRKPIAAAPLVAGDLVYVEDEKGHIGAWRVAP